jgi:hypothetical protein
MKNYIVRVEREAGVARRVEAEWEGITVAFTRSMRQVSRSAWSGSTYLPSGVLGEMRTQAAAVFTQKPRRVRVYPKQLQLF